MQPRHRVSRAAIDLIKAFEGYRRKAARLADGRWTIGYGHTLSAREGAEVSERDAEALLTYDLIAVAHAVNEHVYTPLTQNQFDALTAFVFNIGVGPFRASSVLRRINEGRMLEAANAMELWRRAEFEGERIVIDALVRRRAAEKTLFLTPTLGWVPAPSAILTPGLDLDETSHETPAVLTVSLEGVEALAERDPAGLPPPAQPTATQRAAEAVTARLQTIFPDEAEPVAAPPPAARAPVRPAPAAPANDVAQVELAGRAERLPLPPPAWPVGLGGGDRPFRVPPPSDQDLEPAVAARHEAAAFDPQMLDLAMSDAVEPVAEDASVPAAETRPKAASEAAPLGWAPLGGLAALGVVLFAGGLIWSASAREAGGPFNPWVVGTLACLAGVGVIAVAAYLILARLGRLDGPADEDAHPE